MGIKRFKKLAMCISMSLSVILMSSTVFAAPANTKQISEKNKVAARNFMLSIGLDKKFVSNAPESELLKYVNAKLVSTKEQYYRVTTQQYGDTSKSNATLISKQEAEKEVANHKKVMNKSIYNTTNRLASQITATNGYNEKTTTWLKMVIQAVYNGSNQYTVSNACTWLTVPYYRQTDVIGIGHDTNLTTIQNTAYFYRQWYKYDAVYGNGWETGSSTTADKEDTGGSGFKFYLPSDSSSSSSFPRSYTDFYFYMSYTVRVSSDTYVGSLAMNGDYEHQQTTWGITPSFGYPAGGSIVMSSSGSYDHVNCIASFHN